MVNQNRGLWDIIFGSNHCYETSGIINVKGKELFKIEAIPFEKEFRPLISVEIRDKENKLVGKLHKSTSFVYCDNEYVSEEKSKEGYPERLAIKKKSDNSYIFELDFINKNTAKINGIFNIKGLGFPIIATKDYLDINTNKFSNCKIYKNGSAIIVDKDFIAI
jgi:hypothetical protein